MASITLYFRLSGPEVYILIPLIKFLEPQFPHQRQADFLFQYYKSNYFDPDPSFHCAVRILLITYIIDIIVIVHSTYDE